MSNSSTTLTYLNSLFRGGEGWPAEHKNAPAQLTKEEINQVINTLWSISLVVSTAQKQTDKALRTHLPYLHSLQDG